MLGIKIIPPHSDPYLGVNHTRGKLADQQILRTQLQEKKLQESANGSSAEKISGSSATNLKQTVDGLKDSWTNFKVQLFAEFNRNSNPELLNKYLSNVVTILKGKMTQSDKTAFETAQSDGDYKKQRSIIWTHLGPDRYNNAYIEAFKQFDTADQTRYLNTLAINHGLTKFFDERPNLPIEEKVELMFQEKIKKHFKDSPYEFIATGSTGAVFKIKDGDKSYAVKLSHSDDSKGDQPKLVPSGYEYNGIKKASEIIESEQLPAKNWMQGLAKDKNDLDLSDKNTLVTDFMEGNLLGFRVSPESLKDFVKKGLSNQFLKDFIKSYVTLGEKGADLSSMVHHNAVYTQDKNGGKLNFFDYVGVDTPAYDEKRALIKKDPLTYGIYRLISDFQSPSTLRAKPFMDSLEEAIKSTGSNYNKFLKQRSNQLKQVLREIADDKNSKIGKQDINESLKKIRTLIQEKDQYKQTQMSNTTFGEPFALNKEAQKIYQNFSI